jgi:hypothetical protein
MYVCAILDIGATSGDRVLTWCAPWEDSATFTSHRPTLFFYCVNGKVGGSNPCHADDEIRSTPQGLSKSESHLASLKGDGSPTREVRTFSRGQRVVGRPIYHEMICACPIGRARAARAALSRFGEVGESRRTSHAFPLLSF